MRVFGHTFQPQGILAFAKFFASNLLFSLNVTAARTSAMDPHTHCAHNVRPDTQSALFSNDD